MLFEHANKMPVKAAAYVRMSTEHQKYSPQNQMASISEYASKYGYEIIKTYADEGKSGLNIAGRAQLQQMIKDVENKTAEFKAILVLDITRWGRFQDADESAYYEYICKRAGIKVQYCAEQFENDGSPVSTIIKGVKRTMAAEYSRELSCKVFAGQSRLITMGYKQGGYAGYGLRRMLIDENGNRKSELSLGQYKSLQTDRVILVPGSEEEQKIVRWMYKVFIEEGMNESQIAENLNRRGIKTDLDREWTRGTVHQVLTNEKYIGNNVFNRISYKLKIKRVKNPEDMWVRADGVFEAIVDPGTFYTAKGIITARSRKLSDEEMLDKLKELHNKIGFLSAIVIDEAENMPSSSAYGGRFGGLLRAYQLVGYVVLLKMLYPVGVSIIKNGKDAKDKHEEVIKKINFRGGTNKEKITLLKKYYEAPRIEEYITRFSNNMNNVDDGQFAMYYTKYCNYKHSNMLTPGAEAGYINENEIDWFLYLLLGIIIYLQKSELKPLVKSQLSKDITWN